MNTFYIFTVCIAVSYANIGIEFDNTNAACHGVPDFCSCSRFWVTCDCQNGVRSTAPCATQTSFWKRKLPYKVNISLMILLWQFDEMAHVNVLEISIQGNSTFHWYIVHLNESSLFQLLRSRSFFLSLDLFIDAK